MVDLARLGPRDLQSLSDAGREVAEWQDILAKTGDTIVAQVLGDARVEMAEWAHYPIGDVYDPASHAQYFYHRHGPEGAPVAEPREHGHFHLFMRPRGMAPGTRPLMLPELAIADAPARPLDPVFPPTPQPNQGADNDRFSHIVAIALDASGAPVRLFTSNRWVTGETWYAAEDVIAMIDRFSVELARPSWPVNRWLSALLRFYRLEIAELLRGRDETVMAWRRRHRGKVHVFEDRRLETTSSLRIDLVARLRQIAEAATRAA